MKDFDSAYRRETIHRILEFVFSSFFHFRDDHFFIFIAEILFTRPKKKKTTISRISNSSFGKISIGGKRLILSNNVAGIKLQGGKFVVLVALVALVASTLPIPSIPAAE